MEIDDSDYSEPAFLPEDVDPATHNPSLCNLDAGQCPLCRSEV